VKSRVSRARRALQAILDSGNYERDGASAGEAMGAIMTQMERLSGVK
jgi:RNA polymerase sigma-70 factor (ECF subfamily)